MGDEIEAMRRIANAMEDLEADEAQRVLTWAAAWAGQKFEADFGTVGGPKSGRTGDQGGNNDGGADVRAPFERIGDLMDAASPSHGPEYALVGAYWFQELQGAENVTGQQVNDELKDLGHGVTNITAAFDRLKARTPPLARQVQKTGSTRQGRKRYRLTQEGIRHVEGMLSGSSEG